MVPDATVDKTHARKLLILFGCGTQDRRGQQFLHFTTRAFEANGWCVSSTNARDVGRQLSAFLDMDFEHAPAAIQGISRRIETSDAIVVACGEDSHCVPPVLGTLLHHYRGLASRKPTGIVTYSAHQCGGVRSAMQLRLILSELGMATIPTTFAVSSVGEFLLGTPDYGAPERLAEFEEFNTELTWWADATARYREGVLNEPCSRGLTATHTAPPTSSAYDAATFELAAVAGRRT